MEPDFWHKRWEANQIGFHEGRPNTFLVRHAASLGLAPGARVFVPLCGKTRDIFWLLAQGFRVAGAELSRIAVEQLFAELGVEPQVSAAGPLERFAAPGIDIFVGDIFALDAGTLGKVDAVYDRAALVALPPDLRPRYAAHLVALTARAPQLPLVLTSDHPVMAGPPLSVPPAETHALYDADFRVTELASAEVPGGLRGACPAVEHVWLLTPAS